MSAYTREMVACFDRLNDSWNRDRPLPPRLWHYTDPAGLVGIIRSSSMWLSPIVLLNDSEEFVLAVHYVERAVKEYARHHKEPEATVLLDKILQRLSPTSGADAEQLDRETRRKIEAYVPSMYVACFSENEDDLTQWRGYGGETQGFSIGLSTDGMEDFNQMPGFAFLACRYIDPSTDPAADIIKLVGEVIMVFLRHRQQTTIGLDAFADGFAVSFMTCLGEIVARLKHHGFRQENEWRLIRMNPPPEEICFRAKLSTIMSYWTWHPEAPSRLPIASLWTGPGVLNQLAANQAGQLLAAKNYVGVERSISSIPYRPVK